MHLVEQESPAPGLQTGTGPWPVRNEAADTVVKALRISNHLVQELARAKESLLLAPPP